MLGPQPTGEPWTTAGRSGHRTLAESAGRSGYSSLTSYGGDECSGVRVSPPMAAMACQRFARDDASVCHAQLRVAAWAEPVDLRERGGTDSETQGFEVAARAWHARGQGFKSPQLHQAQRISRTPAQGRLSADCQQITPCGGNNALSAARFRRLQAILTRRIGREQGRPGHGPGSAPAAHLDPLTTTARPIQGRGAGAEPHWCTATATPVRATRSASNSTG